MARRLGLLSLVALLLVAGAGAVLGVGIVAQPQASELPPVATVAPAARSTLKSAPHKLAQDTLKRAAEKLTLRVRNISCQGIATGSGFGIDEHTIITNRHVLAGASVLQLNTWDGTSLDADVDESATARLVDIGASRVHELPLNTSNVFVASPPEVCPPAA